jgi:Fe2+ transport system protein FeoA
MSTSLAEIPLGRTATIRAVEGPRAFRRRLLEMGLVPGVEVRIVTVAPLGDPLRIEVRGGQWSIRRNEAAQIAVEPRGAVVVVPQVAAPVVVVAQPPPMAPSATRGPTDTATHSAPAAKPLPRTT